MIAGVSVAGRPIEAVDIAGAREAPGVGALVFGAIHGDEPGSAELCRRFIAQLAERPPLYRTLVVPVANPDGLQRGQKNNARDVDLNRNFSARNWQRDHQPGYDPGPLAQSEPETVALAMLIERWQPRALVAVHQPFGCVNWDGAGQGLAEMMGQACGYPAVASVGYPTPGSFGSRYGVDESRRVVTFELLRPVPDGDWEGCLAALRCATLFPPG